MITSISSNPETFFFLCYVFKNLFLYGGKLLYNVVLTSVLHKYTYVPNSLEPPSQPLTHPTLPGCHRVLG